MLAPWLLVTTPTTIIMSFGDPHELRTRMMRVEGGELDMGKLAAVDALADQVSAHQIPISEGLARLEAIDRAPPRYGRVLTTATHAVTVGAFAVFFGGSAADVAVAGAIGLLLGVLAAFTKRSVDRARVFELVGSMIAATTAGLASSVWPEISPPLVTVAALIVLLPGLSLTVAMTELTTRHIIAGTSRLVFAVIVLLELVVGVALGSRLANVLVDVQHATPVALPAYAQWIALGARKVARMIGFEWAPVSYARSSVPQRISQEIGLVLAALCTLCWWLAMALSARFVWRQRESEVARAVAATFITVVGVHAVFITDDRYHLVLVGALCAVAANAFSTANSEVE